MEQHPPPTSTHGNAQLPHLAKGEAPLELVVPFKGKGELPGSGAKEERRRGGGDSSPSPGARACQKGLVPVTTLHPACSAPRAHSPW